MTNVEGRMSKEFRITKSGVPTALGGSPLVINSSFSIEFRFLTRVLFQKVARLELVVALGESAHFIDNFLQTKMLGETEGTTAERSEAGSENHSVIGVLRRIDDPLFQTARRFVHHEENKPVRQLLFI